MNKSEVVKYRKVNKLFEFLLNSLNQGYNKNIVFSDDDIKLCKDSTCIFEVLNSFMAIHVAKGHEEDLSKFLDEDWLEILIKDFNITIKPGCGRKDTIHERVKQIRNCVLHRNISHKFINNRVFFENTYAKGETSFENYLLSLYELFTVDQPYMSGIGNCFNCVLPPKENLESEYCIEDFLKMAKFIKYKNPDGYENCILRMKLSEIDLSKMKRSGDGYTFEVSRDKIQSVKRTELDAVIDEIIGILNHQIYFDTAMNVEGQIKKYIKLAKERYPTKYSRESFKHVCNLLLPSIKVYDLKKDLGEEFLERISFIGKENFLSLTKEEKCALAKSVFIDKVMSKERNDNDYYAYMYLAFITDYISKQKTSGSIGIEEIVDQATELKKKYMMSSYDRSLLKLESPIMFENIALAQMHYSVATFKELIDKDAKKAKEDTDDSVSIDLDDIVIPDGVKYVCYVKRKDLEEELKTKTKGYQQEFEDQKNVIDKGFAKNISFRRKLNPKNPKINDVKDSLFNNKAKIQEAYARLKDIERRKGKLDVKKDLLSNSKNKVIEVTDDNKEFFRSMRNALSHNYISIDSSKAYQTKDLNDLLFTFNDYEIEEKTINGKKQKVRGRKTFEAKMSMRDFFELVHNIENTMENAHDKNKISLTDIAKDLILSDLNINIDDIREDLIPTERSR